MRGKGTIDSSLSKAQRQRRAEEKTVPCSENEVTRSHELAPRGSRETVHRSNGRRALALQPEIQLSAERQDVGVFPQATLFVSLLEHKLAEIVASREDCSC